MQASTITPVPPISEDIVATLRLRPSLRSGPVCGRLIGYWRSAVTGGGSPYTDPIKAAAWDRLPWPADHIDPAMPAAERERVAKLLDAAPIVCEYMGSSHDRLDDAHWLLGSGDRATEGWIWPTGLSHYVRTYGLVLPSEMIAALESA